MKGIVSSRSAVAAALLLGGTAFAGRAALADVVSNPVCPAEQVQFNPGNGEDIVVAKGYRVEVFAKGLNFPTDVAFLGSRSNFQVLVLEWPLPRKISSGRT
ncbi:MAG TPA: hypothetical protein VMI74_13805 [Burkholderiales bacterium]|nr:hypothetical protein [Burkholderiales bacterium]